MTIAPGLLIFGFGGHARSVASIALALGVRELIFVDVAARPGENLWGFPVRTEFDGRLPEGWETFAASADHEARRSQVAAIRRRAWPLARLVSPTATIGRDASIADGCFIGHHAHIGPLSSIGTASILNTGSVVDHEGVIGDYTHVSVNASVAGRSRIGEFVFLGAGSTVIDKIHVADSITVGAGSVVTRSLVEPGTYVGTPARLIKRSSGPTGQS